MILITLFITIIIYKYLTNDKNLINIFHPKNKFIALCLLNLEGVFLLIYSYIKRNTHCKSLIELLIFSGIYNILLGISLFMMRITNFYNYLLLFYMIMTVIITTVIILSFTNPEIITQINI